MDGAGFKYDGAGDGTEVSNDEKPRKLDDRIWVETITQPCPPEAIQLMVVLQK